MHLTKELCHVHADIPSSFRWFLICRSLASEAVQSQRKCNLSLQD